ncbi:DUF1552 domain-containing protein [Rubinisphaera margarita]|uniref:DUF1552 domain-containing protein n=1 Tax=Rubinisphaera margarita TaxID=2909586 RepID=UPI001EE945B9|nr:DUF1552 domain-containing protein [Rubinisphaera margarita]MCG6158026.1 DUF1552 domain-containing protein [Rubinisphaera margarita]
MINRRSFIQTLGGGALALPLLESTALATAASAKGTPSRLLIVGNPYGAHPEHFFPTQFGKDFRFPKTISSLEWLRDRISILSHTDHNMKSGHGREISFLSGVLPEMSAAFPEKNMSIDQIVARRVGANTRYASLHACLGRSIRMSWNANGVDIKPFNDVQRMYDHLFQNLTVQERQTAKQLLHQNRSVLDAVHEQFAGVRKRASRNDQVRLDLYANSLRDMEKNLVNREQWVDRDKPSLDLSEYFQGSDITIENDYNAVFDMVTYAFQTDLTRVAVVGYSPELNYTDVDGVNRGYHGCTHNGKKADTVAELVAIESFQVEQMARCLKKLDETPEPNADGSMLDYTVVLFGSGMGYGGTHSNKNLPILVAGGGLEHCGHVDTRDSSGNNMPLCNLYLTLLQHFGLEYEQFNQSTTAFDFKPGKA